MKNGIWCRLFLLSLLAGWAAQAHGGIAMDVLDDLVAQLREDHEALAKVSKRLLVGEVNIHSQISASDKALLTQKLVAALSDHPEIQASLCRECMTPRAFVEDGEVVIKQGLTSLDDRRAFAKSYDADHLATVSVSYSGSHARLLVSAHKAQDGQLSWSGDYATRSQSLESDSTGFFSFTFAQVQSAGGQGFPSALSLVFGERIYGFGEIGMSLFGSNKDGYSREYAALGLHVGFHINQMFSSYWSWSSLIWQLQVSYGFYGKKNKNLHILTGPKLQLGSQFHTSLAYITTSPLDAVDDEDDYDLIDDELVKNNSYPAGVMLGFGFDFG